MPFEFYLPSPQDESLSRQMRALEQRLFGSMQIPNHILQDTLNHQQSMLVIIRVPLSEACAMTSNNGPGFTYYDIVVPQESPHYEEVVLLGGLNNHSGNIILDMRLEVNGEPVPRFDYIPDIHQVMLIYHNLARLAQLRDYREADRRLTLGLRDGDFDFPVNALGVMTRVPIWETSPRGKNWMAVIKPDSNEPGGLNRSFVLRYIWGNESLGGYYKLPQFDAGTAFEFGADWFVDEQRHYRRWYCYVVKQTSELIILHNTMTADIAIADGREYATIQAPKKIVRRRIKGTAEVRPEWEL